MIITSMVLIWFNLATLYAIALCRAARVYDLVPIELTRAANRFHPAN